MNWLTNFVRPKFKALVGQRSDNSDGLWRKCHECHQMIFGRDLVNNDYVCPHCDHHMRLPVTQRLKMLFDGGEWQEVRIPPVPQDPLKFRDRRRYAERLKEAQAKTPYQDALVVGQGKMYGRDVVIAAFDFAFMGGSMGMAVGEGFITAARTAISQKAPLIVVTSSGGARMQEGALSLMQLPRTTVAVQQVKEAGLPYIVVLSDPTTGGVSASYGMLGDVHIAEPGSMIGFAGRRVIEQTVREVLPKGFQTAEYLLEHGMVDMVTHRARLKETLSRLLGLLMDRRSIAKPARSHNDKALKLPAGAAHA